MDTLRAMRIFVRAVELGSLSAVAREQGTTQPTISKLVASLEKHLDVRLFDRTTTSLTPTDQGRRFYERAKRVLEEFGEAVTEAKGLTEKPAGLLRVNAPVSLGVMRLNALMLEFLAIYPDIEIELILNDRFIDLVEEGVDVSLRLGGAPPPNVIARKIGTSRRFLMASPDYLHQHPSLHCPEDLAQHRYLQFAWLSSGNNVELQGPKGQVTVTTSGRYRVNSSLAIRESLLLGAGISIAPEWLVHDLVESQQLVRVLPQWQGPPQDVFLLYPSRRYQPLRLKVFVAFLMERIPSLPGLSPLP